MKQTYRLNRSKPVLYLVGSGNYTHITFTDFTTELFSITLKALMPQYTNLTRIHKGTAVDLSKVNAIDLAVISSNKVVFVLTMPDGKRFEVARRRMGEVRELIHDNKVRL